MKKKIDRGVYDPQAAIQGWMYWVDAAAKSYVKEFASGPYHEIFPKAVRRNVAEEVAKREYELITSGEYDERSARVKRGQEYYTVGIIVNKLDSYTMRLSEIKNRMIDSNVGDHKQWDEFQNEMGLAISHIEEGLEILEENTEDLRF